MAMGQNQTQASLVGGKRSYHCDILAPQASNDFSSVSLRWFHLQHDASLFAVEQWIQIHIGKPHAWKTKKSSEYSRRHGEK